MFSAETAKAINALHEAVFLPELWPDTLDLASRTIGARGGILVPFEADQIDYGYRPSTEFSEAIEAFVRDGWVHADVRRVRAWSHRRSGVVFEQDISSEDERNRLPYYQEWLRPHDLLWWAGIFFEAAGRRWVLSLQRSPTQGPFVREEVAQLTGLVPSLQQIVQLSEQLSRARTVGGLQALELAGTAALMLDERGRVISLNKLAEQTLGRELHLREGRLRASDPECERHLQALVRQTVSKRSLCEVPAGRPLVIPREAQPPLVIRVIPMPSVATDLISGAKALVVLANRDAALQATETILANSFRLTPSEARLTRRLLRGESVAEIADALGLSRETLRTQLKAIFAKTGTRRQAELVAMVSQLVS